MMAIARRSNAKDPDATVREHLVSLLNGGNAHVTFDDAVKGLPPEKRGIRPEGLPYSAWELLEHLRIAQWDILEFSRSAKHASPEWPKGYWPQSAEPPSGSAWDKSVRQFRADLAEMITLVKNSKTDLYAQISWGDGQTILREALLVADHNAYHIGELVTVRRALRCWK